MTRHRLLEIEYEEGKEVILHFRPFGLKGARSASRSHLRNANREFLMAVRSFLDGAIEQLEPKGEEGRGSRRKRVRVTEEKEAGA